jgi:hypothetical protein
VDLDTDEKGVLPSHTGPPVVQLDPSLEHPVPYNPFEITRLIEQYENCIPVLTAPSQLDEIPMLVLAPAETTILLLTVPKLVWVKRKIFSLHLLTTSSDWALITAAANVAVAMR